MEQYSGLDTSFSLARPFLNVDYEVGWQLLTVLGCFDFNDDAPPSFSPGSRSLVPLGLPRQYKDPLPPSFPSFLFILRKLSILPANSKPPNVDVGRFVYVSRPTPLCPSVAAPSVATSPTPSSSIGLYLTWTSSAQPDAYQRYLD